ncbi:MAG: DUF6941 family protein [Limisphaerales bacterium]
MAQTQRIIPDLQSALLCDDVRQEANGSFILLGIMPFIRVPQLPVTAQKLCVYTRWTSGVGQFVEATRFLAPDGTMLRESKVKFELQDPSHNSSNLSVFPGLEIKEEGVYQVEINVDDVMKMRFPVPVLVTPPSEQQGTQPSAEAPPEGS